MNTKTKKIVVSLVAVIAIIAIMLGVYNYAKPKPVEGSKTVAIAVINSEGTQTDYEIKTDAEFLRQAMEEADGLSFSGDEGEFGLMVIEVNGESADYVKDGAYWAFYVNGEYCNYGVDEQPVADGDSFSIEYTPAG